jgi:hypothetical protein
MDSSPAAEPKGALTDRRANPILSDNPGIDVGSWLMAMPKTGILIGGGHIFDNGPGFVIFKEDS